MHTLQVIRASSKEVVAIGPDAAPPPPCTALVMAANRKGIENVLASGAGITHKACLPILGVAMLERVLRALQSVDAVRRIIVSIESDEPLRAIPYVAGLLEAGKIEVITSGPTLADSVRAVAPVLGDADYPLLVTTCDNVLHTSEMLAQFYAGAAASGGDVAAALTPRAVVAQKYPEDAPYVGYLKLAEDEHSNCNVFFFRNARGLGVVEVMKHGGQFRSHPGRILRAVGLLTLIRYATGRLGLQHLCQRMKRLFGVEPALIIFPNADAPIDADNATSVRLIERILRARGESGPSAPGTV